MDKNIENKVAEFDFNKNNFVSIEYCQNNRFKQIDDFVYQGVDIVIDKDLGPLILELNARPGLNIQIANQTGIRTRLELINENISYLKTKEEKINFAKEHFK